MPFSDYDPGIRKVLCLTNAMESLDSRYRRRRHVKTDPQTATEN